MRFFRGFDFYASAKYFCVRVGGFAQKILVVRFNREERGVYARQLAAKFDNFVSAEIDRYVHLLFKIIGNCLFYRHDIVVAFNHIPIVDIYAKNYTLPVFFKNAHNRRTALIR